MDQSFEAEIARHDAELHSINNTLSNLADSFSSRFNKLEASIGRLAGQFNNHNRTPWSMLAGWAAVVLVVIGFLGNGYVRDMQRVERDGDAVGVSFVEHIKDGHPGVVRIGMEANTRHIEQNEKESRDRDAALDIALQREMRMLTESLDARLQLEMRLLGDTDRQRIIAIERQVFK